MRNNKKFYKLRDIIFTIFGILSHDMSVVSAIGRNYSGGICWDTCIPIAVTALIKNCIVILIIVIIVSFDWILCC